MMTLQTTKFGVACALATAILWIICSLLVVLMPVAMMNLSGHMMHGDFSMWQWRMGMHGFFFGLIAWSLVAGVFGWLLTVIYNKLV